MKQIRKPNSADGAHSAALGAGFWELGLSPGTAFRLAEPAGGAARGLMRWGVEC